MADNRLGERLYEVGWRQGVLLPALPYSVIFQVDDPLSKIAKQVARQQTTIKVKQGNPLQPADSLPFSVGVATGITRKGDYLVIASQDCDIASNLSEEPHVIAMRAFCTENATILRYASSNSSHYFLLDHRQGLVAEASIMVLIEKPVLAHFTPESGTFDATVKERFARWIAHRFTRTVFHESVVGAVIKPILDHLAQMQQDMDPDLEALDQVREVRLGKITGNPPYEVRLLFIVPESGLQDGGTALARLINRMREWFNPLAARLIAWDARHLYEITVGDYLDTERFYLDHYSYRGQTIRGLLPPSVI
jgi:hypothetical protein